MEEFIAIFAIFCLFGLPILAGIILIIRLTNSDKKERLEMIKRGMIPPEKKEVQPSRLRTLRTGIGAIGIALGLIIGVILINYVFGNLEDLEMFVVIVGSTFLFFGIAYVIYYIISKDKIEKEDEE